MEKILESFILSNNSKKLLLEIFDEIDYKKNEKLCVLGEISNDFFVLKKGIIRSFYSDVNGKYHTRFLLTPTVALASLASLISEKPSTMVHECLTDCTVFKGDFKKFKKLAKKNIELSNLYSLILEDVFIRMEQRDRDLTSLDAKQLYLKLKSESPEIEKSIPLYHIASYLNVTPIQLSRIRRDLYKS